MHAEIRAVDTTNPSSEGHGLSVDARRIDLAVKEHEGLPLGEHKDRFYIELTAESSHGPTRSTLTAQMDAVDLQQLFEVAVKAGLVVSPQRKRLLALVQELRAELDR